MNNPAQWQELVGGFADEPKASSMDELCSLPHPHDFFERAFLDLCDVDVRKGGKMKKEEIPPFGRRTWGFQGSEEIGLRWVEEQDRESSLVPLRAKSISYGLPGMTIYWEYRWDYASQAGHAAFRHTCLKALFESPETQRRFVALWRIIFKKTPVFRPASEPPPGIEPPPA